MTHVLPGNKGRHTSFDKRFEENNPCEDQTRTKLQWTLWILDFSWRSIQSQCCSDQFATVPPNLPSHFPLQGQKNKYRKRALWSTNPGWKKEHAACFSIISIQLLFHGCLNIKPGCHRWYGSAQSGVCTVFQFTVPVKWGDKSITNSTMRCHTFDKLFEVKTTAKFLRASHLSVWLAWHVRDGGPSANTVCSTAQVTCSWIAGHEAKFAWVKLRNHTTTLQCKIWTPMAVSGFCMIKNWCAKGCWCFLISATLSPSRGIPSVQNELPQKSRNLQVRQTGVALSDTRDIPHPQHILGFFSATFRVVKTSL